MNLHLKNMNLLVIKIPCIVMSILMTCALILIIKSQYSEMITNFKNQCKQYNSAMNLQLSKTHSNSSTITHNAELIDNLTIENHTEIRNILKRFSYLHHSDISGAYIISKNNIIYSTHGNAEPVFKDYTDAINYTSDTLVYAPQTQNRNSSLLYIYPLYDSSKSHSGILVIEFLPDKFLENIVYEPENPTILILHSNEFSEQFSNDISYKFLYTISETIPLQNSDICLTLKISIIPIIKTTVYMLLIFVLIFIIFYAILRFLAHCLQQSISQPLEQMHSAVRSYTSSVTENTVIGSEENDF